MNVNEIKLVVKKALLSENFLIKMAALVILLLLLKRAIIGYNDIMEFNTGVEVFSAKGLLEYMNNNLRKKTSEYEGRLLNVSRDEITLFGNQGQAKFEITGQIEAGGVLTISMNSGDPDGNGQGYNYSWKTSDNGLNWTGDETGTQYTINNNDKLIKIDIDYTDNEGHEESLSLILINLFDWKNANNDIYENIDWLRVDYNSLDDNTKKNIDWERCCIDESDSALTTSFNSSIENNQTGNISFATTHNHTATFDHDIGKTLGAGISTSTNMGVNADANSTPDYNVYANANLEINEMTLKQVTSKDSILGTAKLSESIVNDTESGPISNITNSQTITGFGNSVTVKPNEESKFEVKILQDEGGAVVSDVPNADGSAHANISSKTTIETTSTDTARATMSTYGPRDTGKGIYVIKRVGSELEVVEVVDDPDIPITNGPYYQWQSSVDEVNWENVGNNLTYTITDENKAIRCIITYNDKYFVTNIITKNTKNLN